MSHDMRSPPACCIAARFDAALYVDPAGCFGHLILFAAGDR
jgi:hypothetical protein